MKQIEMKNIEQILIKGAKEMGIELPVSAPHTFSKYCEFLTRRAKSLNLTAIKDEVDIARLHFLDSLALLNYADFKDAKVIDVGSGAGFPGIPLKIAVPSIELTLLDSANKRISFLHDLLNILKIEAKPIHARAEEASRHAEIASDEHPSDESHKIMREQYDIVVSRALAKLNVLCELCLPFLRIGGSFMAMKSQDSDEEVKEAQNAINLIGGKLLDSHIYKIPNTSHNRRIITIQKIAKTSKEYPRRYAKISKKPIIPNS